LLRLGVGLAEVASRKVGKGHVESKEQARDRGPADVPLTFLDLRDVRVGRTGLAPSSFWVTPACLRSSRSALPRARCASSIGSTYEAVWGLPRAATGGATYRSIIDLCWRYETTGKPAGETNLVFAASNGAVMSPSNLRRRVLKPAAEKARVEWIGFHAFRHTCASLLFAEGRNAVQVQR
jgi:hypothetical protein